jgi:hypothetical protein
MNKNKRSLIAYALSISMLFNAATDNQNKKVDHAILPEDMYIEEPFSGIFPVKPFPNVISYCLFSFKRTLNMLSFLE